MFTISVKQNISSPATSVEFYHLLLGIYARDSREEYVIMCNACCTVE